MNDEFDSPVDTSFDDTTSDVSDPGGSTENTDISGIMDDPIDASEYADDFYDDHVDDYGSELDAEAILDATSSEPISDVPNDTSSDIDNLMSDIDDTSDGSSTDTTGELPELADDLVSGEFNDTSSDVESLMDDTSDVTSIMDDTTDLGYEDQTTDDTQEDTASDITSLMDDSDETDVYQARPNSDIEIAQDDGSVKTIEELMSENEDSHRYRARSNSDIEIAQNDGSVKTLEELISENVDTEENAQTDVDLLLEDQPVDDLDAELSADVEVENLLEGTAEDHTDVPQTAQQRMEAYLAEHNYGPQHRPEYMQDPQWQELNNALLVEMGREPIDYETQDWTDTHVDDIRAEMIAAGMSEDDPYLAAILLNEQRGINAIRAEDAATDVDTMMDDTDDTGSASEGSVDLLDDVVDEVGSTADPTTDITTLMDDVDANDEPSDVVDGDDTSDASSPIDSPIHLTQSDVDWYIENANDPESLRQMQAGIASGRIVVDADTEIPTDVTIDGTSDVQPEIDYEAVYSGLDSYDFDGVDVSTDMERLDPSLESFQSGTWENLSVDDQKAAMSDLADYVKDVIGFENPPDIVYYNNPVDGDYGGYSPGTNTLSVNEYMLYDNNEAADTIAHELWHAYQHERAMNPQSAKDYQYQYGFDNYIRPDDDFTAYQDQLVEAEARAFAQQFKDRLKAKGRGI